MKKTIYLSKIFLLTLILLLAAGCAKNEQQMAQKPIYIEKKSEVKGESIEKVIPKGGEKEYQDVFTYVSNRCGNVELLYFYAPVAVSNNKPVNVYYFTSGTCKPNQQVSMGYDRTDKKLSGSLKYSPLGKAQVLPLKDWRIPYLEAVIAAKSAGGEKFLNKHKSSFTASALLQNETETGFRWVVTFKASEESKAEKLEVYVNPIDGELF